MEEVMKVIPLIAFLLSLASFFIAQRSAIKAKRAEAISHLLGEKETVAYAALKLLRDGLPSDQNERKLVIAALLQACVFEGSDRARALLYRVIELNRKSHSDDIRQALDFIAKTFESMRQYEFSKDELDLSRGQRRLANVERVIGPKVPIPNGGA